MTDSTHTAADKLDLILEQTTLTNGRVIRLNEEVFGDPSKHTAGLIAEVAELRGIVYDWRAVGRAIKWGVPIIGLSSLGTFAKVLVG